MRDRRQEKKIKRQRFLYVLPQLLIGCSPGENMLRGRALVWRRGRRVACSVPDAVPDVRAFAARSRSRFSFSSIRMQTFTFTISHTLVPVKDVDLNQAYGYKTTRTCYAGQMGTWEALYESASVCLLPVHLRHVSSLP